MKKFASLLLMVFAICACSEKKTPAEYVNPFIGTDFHGHTYPGATTPFGMVQLSPDTRLEGWDGCSGYHYSDNGIIGFSHTHLSGTGCADLCDVLVRPSTTKPALENGLYVKNLMEFSHSDESACAGYYTVDLKKEGFKAELTARQRTGVHKYTFNGEGSRYVLIDLINSTGDQILHEASIQAISDTEVNGMKCGSGWTPKQYVYFNARFSEPFVSAEVADNKQILLTFAENIQTLEIAVGISAVSEENARENSVAEMPAIDFSAAKTAALADWDKALSDIVVTGGTEDEKTIFYTAQYHTKINPNVMNDVNGQFRRNNGEIATVKKGESYYSTLSLWDTFRAWHPLQTIVNPQLATDIINSMLDMYDAQGELPIWPLSSGETKTMIGYHAVSVISDAYCKGIRNFDAEKALAAMIHSSNINGKAGDQYVKYGYVPSNVRNESVALTLEYAYDDWCIARMAEQMGKTEIAEEYYRRAHNYENVFDGQTSFFRGRNSGGGWVEPFDIFATSRDFTEATPWHYRFCAPHDIVGMEQLFGGPEKFEKAVDDLFHLEVEKMDIGLSDVTGFMGQYAHGNEPSHHMAYLYSFIGKSWKTEELTRELLDVMYTAEPDGIIGNEDCGQMSAWYVMSALGMYSVCPGIDQFVLTTPLFPQAEINLPNGKKFTLKADGADKKRYIKSVSLNGTELKTAYITYDQIMGGGELVFELSSTPVKDRNIEVPYSMTNISKVSAPFTTADPELFEGELTVDLATVTDGADIYYSIDGSEPSIKYTEPFRIDRTVELKAKAVKEGSEPSRVAKLLITKAEYKPSVKASASENGVKYSYFESRYTKTADMVGKPVKTGTLPRPELTPAQREDYYGFIYEGFIKIDERGVWEFRVHSDDGGALYIDGDLVVNNDGSHSAFSSTGRVALDKGYHAFTLKYFEDYEGQELKWGWKTPGSEEFTDIPDNKLFVK